MVPPEGDVISGFRIPGGTFIGLNAWGTQLDTVYGDDPEIFRPERWLTTNEERMKAMRQTLELVFGHGSTKCLGMPLAIMELNKIIFEVSPAIEDVKTMVADYINGLVAAAFRYYYSWCV